MGHETRSAIQRLNWLGIVLIALGVAAVLTPAVAGSAVVIVIGFILLVAGIVVTVRGLNAEAGMEKAMGLILGIITALAGIAVIGHPLLGLAFLTLLLVGYSWRKASGRSSFHSAINRPPAGSGCWRAVRCRCFSGC